MNEAGTRFLAQLLLGRNLSESATATLSIKEANDAFQGIILADEFLGNIEDWLRGAAPLPQEARRITLGEDLLQWFDDNIDTAPEFRRHLHSAMTWKRFMSLMLTDSVVLRSIERKHRAHRNFTRFWAAAERLKQANALTDSTAIPSNPSGPAAGAIDTPAGLATPAQSPEQTISPAEFLSEINGASISEKELDILSSTQDIDLLARLIQRIYSDKRHVVLFSLWKRLRDSEFQFTDHFEALVSFYTARMLISRNSSRTANIILENMRDTNKLDALTQRELKVFPQVLAQSLVRTGRFTEAVHVLQQVLAEEPTHAESIFQCAALLRFDRPDLSDLYFRKLLGLNPKLRADRQLLAAQFFLDQGDFQAALNTLTALYKSEQFSPDVELGLGNVSARFGDEAGWRGHLRSYFGRHHLQKPNVSGAPAFSALASSVSGTTRDDGPKVSVIMTAFNAASTLQIAVDSVLQQTHQNFEIFIVDDCSTDNTRSLIEQMAAIDPRITLLVNEENLGTYASKTLAIIRASGEYVTFHDSDDWMHPERLETHLNATTKPGVKASISKWIRMDEGGNAIVRSGGGYLHENPASTFIHHSVFAEIGYFDSVRTGADSELLWRMIGTYGADSVVTIAKPLGIGLHHSASLTQSGATAFDVYRFSAVRLEYWESWVHWQLNSLSDGTPMFVAYPLKERHWPAPEEIVVTRG